MTRTKEFIIKTIISVFASALGGGLAIAFGLDERVANMLGVATEAPNLWAITLILSGVVGVVTFTIILNWKAIKQKFKSAPSKKASFAPDYDASASEGFRHLIVESKWALGKHPNEDDFLTDVEGELRDAARNGRLQVWARTFKKMKGGFKETLAPIPTKKWDVYKFDLQSCMYLGGNHASITDYTKYPYTSYEDARISRQQLVLNWPKASESEKKNDIHYPERKEFCRLHQESLHRKYGKKKVKGPIDKSSRRGIKKPSHKTGEKTDTKKPLLSIEEPAEGYNQLIINIVKGAGSRNPIRANQNRCRIKIKNISNTALERVTVKLEKIISLNDGRTVSHAGIGLPLRLKLEDRYDMLNEPYTQYYYLKPDEYEEIEVLSHYKTEDNLPNKDYIMGWALRGHATPTIRRELQADDYELVIIAYNNKGPSLEQRFIVELKDGLAEMRPKEN